MSRQIRPTSKFDSSDACLRSRPVDQSIRFGLINEADKETQAGDLRAVLSTAKTWWRGSTILLRLVLLTTSCWHTQSGAAADPYSFEFEKSPSQPDFYFRDRSQRQANERQEFFRVRVPIRDAVGPNVRLASSLTSQKGIGSLTQSPAASPPLARQIFLFMVVLILPGMLVVRKLAPKLLAKSNRRINPGATDPATARNLSAALRRDEKAFAAYRAAFQAAPLHPRTLPRSRSAPPTQ